MFPTKEVPGMGYEVWHGVPEYHLGFSLGFHTLSSDTKVQSIER